MNILDIFRVSINDILSHKVRALLTATGIIVGIASLITTLALVAGQRKYTLIWIQNSGGFEMVTVNACEPLNMKDKALCSVSKGLTYEDAEAISGCPLVKYVSPEVYLGWENTVIYKDKKTSAELMGVTKTSLLTLYNNDYDLAQGRFITQNDLDNFNRICVLGSNPKYKLMKGIIDPVGETVKINGNSFKVIGLLKHYELTHEWGGKKYNSFDWKNRRIFIPLTTAQNMFTGDKKLSSITFTVKDPSRLSDAVYMVREILLKQHRYVEDFKITTREDWIESIKKFLRELSIVSGLIGGAGLLVGGIGIMNIMLATIAERTREIGIRKAVGAKDSYIFLQFLIEAVLLSLMGGVLGIISGLGLVRLLRLFGSPENELLFYVQINFIVLLIPFVFSVIIGILAGLMPAIRAARLNPIEALRHE